MPASSTGDLEVMLMQVDPNHPLSSDSVSADIATDGTYSLAADPGLYSAFQVWQTGNGYHDRSSKLFNFTVVPGTVSHDWTLPTVEFATNACDAQWCDVHISGQGWLVNEQVGFSFMDTAVTKTFGMDPAGQLKPDATGALNGQTKLTKPPVGTYILLASQQGSVEARQVITATTYTVQ